MSEVENPVVIEAQGLVKRYNVYSTPMSRLKEVLCFNRRSFHREFTALESVDLRITKGQTVGVLGQNGAGKSTLLKILAGIITPTEGDLRVEGKVSSIIELGTGFHPDFTGCENARINAAILGFREKEIDEIYGKIVQFAELGNYIDMPVKTYSSGMFARLAFSIAIHVKPDVLLVDEALAVGDAIFSQRCLQQIRRMQEAGVTIFFVSHDSTAVRGLCDEVIIMERGRVIAQGPPKETVQQYEIMVAERLAQSSADGPVEFHDVGALETGQQLVERRYGTFEAKIEEIVLENEKGEAREKFISGETMRVRLRVRFNQAVENPVFGIMIRNRFGAEVFGTNTLRQKLETGSFAAGSRIDAIFDVRLQLGRGSYQLSLAAHTADYGIYYDYRVDCQNIEVLGADDSIGMVPLETAFSVQRKTATPS